MRTNGNHAVCVPSNGATVYDPARSVAAGPSSCAVSAAELLAPPVASPRMNTPAACSVRRLDPSSLLRNDVQKPRLDEVGVK